MHTNLNLIISPNFIQSIGGIGDQLSEENFFIGVKCVDNERHKLCNLSLEGECLNFIRHLCVSVSWFDVGCVAVISQTTEAMLVSARFMYSRNSLEPSRIYYSTGTGYYVTNRVLNSTTHAQRSICSFLTLLEISRLSIHFSGYYRKGGEREHGSEKGLSLIHI